MQYGSQLRHQGKMPPKGAYGLTWVGLEDLASSLLDAPADWPAIAVERRLISTRLEPEDHIGSDESVLPLAHGGRITMYRRDRLVICESLEALDRRALVHPYLAPVASMFSYWLNRESFHCGAFVIDGGVWGLIGARGRGKSTTLAYLASLGVGIFSDDVLVVDDGTAFAGPRAIDLRSDVAAALGVGAFMGTLGQRERWRVELDPVPAELPMRGWLFLEWGDAVRATSASAAERLTRLAEERAMRLAPRKAGVLLTLAALPCWRLQRPRGLDSLDAAAKALLQLIG